MQRPIEILKNDEEVMEAQIYNLRSAVALSAIATPHTASVDEFYKNILKIPHYQTTRLFSLMDSEDTTEIIVENRDEFKKLYGPILEDEPFRNLLHLEEGLFHKKDDPESRATMMMEMSDNVF